jgi:drug/metabolite transporter (DMT)-like permease
MRGTQILGIVLIIAGVIMLAVGGFRYTDRDTVVDAGPIQIEAERERTVPLSPIAGGAALVGGIVLLVVGSRSRSRI